MSRQTVATAVPRPDRGVAKRGRPTVSGSAGITAAILDAATELFIGQGYEATSMARVAEAAGIPKSTLYKRYEDKRALAAAVLRRRVERWSAAAADEPAPDAAIGEVLARRIAVMLDRATDPEVRAFTRLSRQVGAGGGAGSGYGAIPGFDTMRSIIADDLVRAGERDGHLPADAPSVAEVVMALVSGWLERRGWAPFGPQGAAGEARFLAGLIVAGRAAW